MRRGAFFSWYGLAWTAAVLLLGFGVYWLNTLRPTGEKPVALENIKLDSSKGGPTQAQSPVESIDEQAAALELGLKEAELSITSDDGSVTMTLWADAGTKKAGNYRINTGALLFNAKNTDSVLIRVTDASFVREAGTAKVRGTLTGYIFGSKQYFTAQELYWDKDSSSITAHAVRYVGPSVEVSGSKMRINLLDKSVSFEGPVEAGI